MIDWAAGLVRKLTFAIEGTGSYGAGLTAAVRRQDIGVIEILRTDRRDRRLRGKNDTLDAENAARAVLGGHATATPKTNDGSGRDAPPDPGRQGHRGQGPHRGDDQPQGPSS